MVGLAGDLGVYFIDRRSFGGAVVVNSHVLSPVAAIGFARLRYRDVWGVFLRGLAVVD